MTRPQASYYPQAFEVKDEAEAREIILTSERGTTTDERWEKETAFLKGDVIDFLAPDPGSLILDYGCGIGRMAKVLVESTGCSVIGVDISASMRRLAPGHVGSDRFSVLSKTAFERRIAKGLRVDACVALWVLQHCLRVREDVQLIKSALRPGGLLYVLNNFNSVVPTNVGWVNDGVEIIPILDAEFEVVDVGRLPAAFTTEALANGSFIAKLKIE